MENSKMKKKNWGEAKIKFLEKVPKRFKIRIDGIEDDSPYCHPSIELDDNMVIRGQMDTDSTDVYGLSLEIKKEITIGCFVYRLSIPISTGEHFDYLVNNYEKIKQSLIESFVEIEKLYNLKHDLELVQNNIIHNAICKEVDKSKLKDSIQKIYTVTEYLENKRLAE